MPDQQQPQIEVKAVKHTFTGEEIAELNSEFRRAYEDVKVVNLEFDSVKATYKAKISEKESRMETLSATLNAGFEMRNKRCVFTFDVANRRKLYFLEDDPEASEPILIQEMTASDFQQDLLIAESKFEAKTELQLFPQAGNDRGLLVLGRIGKRWFAALRVSIGPNKLDERLDSEQPSFKTRPAALDRTVLKYQEWLTKNLGKDNAKGFAVPLEAALVGQRELAE